MDSKTAPERALWIIGQVQVSADDRLTALFIDHNSKKNPPRCSEPKPLSRESFCDPCTRNRNGTRRTPRSTCRWPADLLSESVGDEKVAVVPVKTFPRKSISARSAAFAVCQRVNVSACQRVSASAALGPRVVS